MLRMMYIKESYVYTLPDREMHCHSEGCGYWRSNNDSSMTIHLRMFKVNGTYRCEGCLKEMLEDIKEALE
jgi:hypothetical protein